LKDYLSHILEVKNHAETNNIITMFDLGVFFGGILIGLFSDLWLDRRRVFLMIPFGIVACGILIGIIIFNEIYTYNYVFYMVMIFFYGFFLGGPY